MQQSFIVHWLSGPVTKYRREIDRFRSILKDRRYDSSKVARTWRTIDRVLSNYVKVHVRFSRKEAGLWMIEKNAPRLGPDTRMEDADLLMWLGMEGYAPAKKLLERHRVAVLAIIGLHEAKRGNGRGILAANNYVTRREITRLRPDAELGRKVLDGGRLGEEIAHGTAEEKSRRYAAYTATVELLRKQNPRLSHTRLCQLAALEHRVSSRTILRHVAKN